MKQPGSPRPDPPPPMALDRRVAGLKRSPTLAINECSVAREASGRRICRLGFGQSPFPVPETVVESLRRHAGAKAYLPVEGLPELRDAIAGYFNRTRDLELAGENILVGPGTKMLMYILQLACDAEILIPSPSWVSYAPQAMLCGRPVQQLETGHATGYTLTASQLEEACARGRGRRRLLILNDPGNPTGTAFAAGQLREIADVARRFGVLVLSDEIYSGLRFSGQHISIARFYPEGTIVSDGLSKWCGAGGWRLGAFAMPRELFALRDAMAAVASETFSSVAAAVQHAAVTAFAGNPDIDAHVAHSREILHALLSRSAEHLRNAGVQVCSAAGGFYLFPDFGPAVRARRNAPVTAAVLCRRLLEEAAVAVLPGTDFGRDPGELTARLAIVDFDGEAALAAARGRDAPPDDDFIDQFCRPAWTGIENLGAWIENC